MKNLSLGKGLIILLVGVMGASCSKEVQEQPFDKVPASEIQTTAATTTTAPSVGTPIGYAAYNGITTGGKGGKTVKVSTLSAFKSAVTSTSPMIVTVSGVIKGAEVIYVKSNKTIIGLSGATLEGIGLKMSGVSNIIIKNIISKNMRVSGSDNLSIDNKSHHIWVDHSTFSGTQDGLLDITGASDYVTVSWSKFTGAAKNNLVGGGDASYGDRGKLHVTYHHNLFSNNLERSPSVRFGRVHVFNNYYYNTSTATNSYGVAARIESIVRTDNNYFENFKGNPLRTIDPSPGYLSGINTNVYKNSGSNKIATKESTWKPPYSYSSALLTASNVPAAVRAGAGAK